MNDLVAELEVMREALREKDTTIEAHYWHISALQGALWALRVQADTILGDTSERAFTARTLAVEVANVVADVLPRAALAQSAPEPECRGCRDRDLLHTCGAWNDRDPS